LLTVADITHLESDPYGELYSWKTKVHHMQSQQRFETDENLPVECQCVPDLEIFKARIFNGQKDWCQTTRAMGQEKKRCKI
jgi:hypothetical protein